MTIEIFDRRSCMLGEGPHFDDRTGRAVWVDILGCRVLWRAVPGWGPPEGESVTAPGTAAEDAPAAGSFGTGAHVGAAVPTTTGGLVLCLTDRLVLHGPVGPGGDLVRYPPAAGPARRSNDAKADPAGRLWHGTMAYDMTPGAGTLYRLGRGGVGMRPVVEALTVPNGLGWSPDGATMYLVDTSTLRVDAFDYDLSTGVPSGRRPFVTVEPGAGLPDGLCVDATGGVWVALWGGAAVHRYTPDGVLERTVELPTPQVTSCAFVGAAFDQLLITTAADGRVGDPLAGLTFLHRPGDVAGAPCDRYEVGR